MEDNVNILPEKIIRTKDRNGKSIWSEVYSLDSYSDLGFVGLIAILAVTLVIFPFFSSLCLLAYVIDMHLDNRPIYYNLIGFIVSVYLLIDMHNRWLISLLMSVFSSAKELDIAKTLNITLALTHVLVLILGNVIYKLSGENKFISFLCIGVLVLMSYLLSDSVYNFVISAKAHQ